MAKTVECIDYFANRLRKIVNAEQEMSPNTSIALFFDLEKSGQFFSAKVSAAYDEPSLDIFESAQGPPLVIPSQQLGLPTLALSQHTGLIKYRVSYVVNPGDSLRENSIRVVHPSDLKPDDYGRPSIHQKFLERAIPCGPKPYFDNEGEYPICELDLPFINTVLTIIENRARIMTKPQMQP